MFRKLKIAALSALLGLGTLAAVPAGAQAAEGFYFSFGNNGVHGGVYDHKGGRKDWRHHRPRRDVCDPREAVQKAHRMGLRDVRVTRANRNTIRVVGERRWHRAAVVFARAPNCPVISAR